MGSKIGDLLRQLAIAYDDLELDTQNRFEYLENKVNKQSKKLNTVRFGLSTIVDHLKDEEDTEYDFNQK